MATPYPIDDAVLELGIRHVCYEYANLLSAAHWSINGQAPWRTNVDDAFILGYRKLGEFLLKKRRSKRDGAENPDILARDYLPSGRIQTWTLPAWETEWKEEMDKQLAHITFIREKEWVHLDWVPLLESEMRTAWAEFLAAVDPRHQAEFATQLAVCRVKPGFAGLRV